MVGIKRRWIFRLLLCLPAIIVISFVFFFSYNIYQINKVDHYRVAQVLNQRLLDKQGDIFDFPSNFERVNEFEKSIYIFGASSVISSEKNNFDYYLGKHFSKDGQSVTVVNFGIGGIDSFSIKRRMEQVFSSGIKKPSLIVLYYGHNDYNNQYHDIILPEIFQSVEYLFKLMFFFYDPYRNHFDMFNCYSESARLFRIKLIRILQLLKLIKINKYQYAQYNSIILKYLKQNTVDIVNMVAGKKIPLIFVTPIGNLQLEPSGDIDFINKYYSLGIREKKYDQAIDFLMTARDSEIFTYNVRVKTEFVDYIRKLHLANLYVFDLEKLFRKKKIIFGNNIFLDEFHFSDESHKLIGNLLYLYIKSKNLIA